MHKHSLAILPLLAASALAQGIPEIEVNDTAATATPIALGRQGDGAITTAGDVDFWKITLSAASDLQIWVNPGRGTSLADSDLTLLAADGSTALLFDDDAVAPQSWLSAIVAGDLAAGDYYLRVRSSQAKAPNGTGTYTIDFVEAQPGTYIQASGGPGALAAVSEGAEVNDPRIVGGVATTTTLASRNSGNIANGIPGTGFTDIGADYDFYAVQVTTPGLLTMTVQPIAPYPAMRNTVLFLADAALSPIAVDDDGGFGRFSALKTYVYPGTWYVVLKGHDQGNYVLDIELLPFVMNGQTSVTVHNDGCGPTLGLRQTSAGPVVTTEAPVLGSAYYLDAANMPANAFLIRVIGVDPLLPSFDLGPFGAPGCMLYVDPLDQSPATADANGRYYWPLFSTPLQIGLVGLTIEQQIAVVDPTANSLGMSVSNHVSSICGLRN